MLIELLATSNYASYNIKLAEYKEKEKAFLIEVKKKVEEYRSKVDTTLPKKVQNLQVRLFKAKEYVKFYEKYTKLTYEAELVYEQSKLEIAQEAVEKISSTNESYINSSGNKTYIKDSGSEPTEGQIEIIKTLDMKSQEGIKKKIIEVQRLLIIEEKEGNNKGYE